MTDTTPKTKRNKELFEDYRTGVSMLDIQNKYQLSQTRVYAIVSKFKKKGKKYDYQG